MVGRDILSRRGIHFFSPVFRVKAVDLIRYHPLFLFFIKLFQLLGQFFNKLQVSLVASHLFKIKPAARFFDIL